MKIHNCWMTLPRSQTTNLQTLIQKWSNWQTSNPFRKDRWITQISRRQQQLPSTIQTHLSTDPLLLSRWNLYLALKWCARLLMITKSFRTIIKFRLLKFPLLPLSRSSSLSRLQTSSITTISTISSFQTLLLKKSQKLYLQTTGNNNRQSQWRSPLN